MRSLEVVNIDKGRPRTLDDPSSCADGGIHSCHGNGDGDG